MREAFPLAVGSPESMTAVRCVTVLFALLSLLANPVHAQQEPSNTVEERTARLFELGMTALEIRY